MVIGDKTGGTLNTHTGLTPRFDLALLPNVTKGGGVGVGGLERPTGDGISRYHRLSS